MIIRNFKIIYLYTTLIVSKKFLFYYFVIYYFVFFNKIKTTWEQRKLGEVAERFDNLRVPITASSRIPGINPYYGANGIQDFVNGYTHDGEFILVAEDGANDLKDYPIHYVNGKVWVNNHAHVLQGKDNICKNIYLKYSIKSINLEPFLVGGGRSKLNSDVMMKLEIFIPSIIEQINISKFIVGLEKLITLHQRNIFYISPDIDLITKSMS